MYRAQSFTCRKGRNKYSIPSWMAFWLEEEDAELEEKMVIYETTLVLCIFSVKSQLVNRLLSLAEKKSRFVGKFVM